MRKAELQEKLGIPQADEYEGINEWFLDYWNKEKKVEHPEHLDDVKKALNSMGDLCAFLESAELKDALEDRFGDHIEVTITKKKISTEECSHG